MKLHLNHSLLEHYILINLAIHNGGTDYFSDDITIPTAFGPITNIWEADPKYIESDLEEYCFMLDGGNNNITINIIKSNHNSKDKTYRRITRYSKFRRS